MTLLININGTNRVMTDAERTEVRDGIGAASATALAAKADLVGGKIPAGQIPDIALQQYLGAVANEAAMLALLGQAGDWCTRSDTGTDWRIIGNPASLAGWLQTSYPSAPVSSVNGKTGAVTLAKADVGLGNVDNTSDASKPISTATAMALAGKMDASLSAWQMAFDAAPQAQKAQAQASVSGAGITDAQAQSGSVAGAAVGELRRLTDGPNTGVQVMWYQPSDRSTPAWCWAVYPQSVYQG